MTIRFTILFILLCNSFLANAQAPFTPTFVMEEDILRADHAFVQGKNVIQLCGLQPGEEYGIRWTGVPAEFSPSKVLVTAGQQIEAGLNPIRFRAESSCVNLTLYLPKTANTDPFPNGIAAWHQQTRKMVSDGSRNVFVTNASTEFLVRNILMAGAGCWDIRNITELGSFASRGMYSGSPAPGIGVCLSTGMATDANGINNSPNVGTDFGGWGDADLTATIFPFVFTFDASSISFDFTAPYTGALSFDIMWASEEYPSGNCDGFGIFASGPGITGPYTGNSQFYGVAPNTSYPINACNIGPNGIKALYVDNTDGKEIQYDGYSIPMKVFIPIQECGEYHIKFVVADTNDGLNDSAVFIAGNTYGYEQSSTVEVVIPTSNDNVAFEECSDAYLHVCRADQDNLFPDLVVDYSVSPLSTAVLGVDYGPLPSQFVIPAGEPCVDIPIDLIYDPAFEIDKSLIVDLVSPCPCLNPTAELIIRDTPPLDFTLDDITVCQDDDVFFEPSISSGVEPYTYAWSDGSTDDLLSYYAEIPGTENYSVTITDRCGRSMVKTGKVTIAARPIATMEGDGYLCKGNTKDTIPVTITLEPPSSAPWNISYWINGVLQPVLTNITTPVITIPVTTPGFSQIKSVFNNSVCDGIIFGESFIESVEISADLDTVPVSCYGIKDGSLLATGQEGFEPYTFQWSVPGENMALLDSIGVGKYFVTVTDQLGCTVVDSVTMTSQTDIIVDGLLINGTDCTTPTGAVDLTVSGGNLPYTYLWSNGSILEDPSNLPEGTAFVTVTDNKGCESYASFPIPVPDAPDITPSVTGTVTCAAPNGGAAVLQVNGGTMPYGFAWSGNGGNQKDPVNLTGGSYTVTVTDAAGCSALATIDIPVDTLTPFAQVGPPDTLTCGVTTLLLDGIGSTVGPEFTYQWTTNNGQILNGGTTLQPEIGLPGQYALLVTNTTNGCTASATVQIHPDQNAPDIQLMPADTLTCAITSTVLDASGSTSGPNIQISWSTANGQILSGGTTLQPTIGAPGTYTLILTNTSNNCIATEDIEVPGLNALLQADISGPMLITCTTPQITLDGMGSTITPGSNFTWTTASGNIVGGTNGTSIQVDDAGDYTLVIKDPTSGCADTTTVNVALDKMVPTAAALPNGILNCLTSTVTLDGSGSSPGTDIEYLWSTVNGNLTGPAQNKITTCNAAGAYTLLVTDTGNGCTSSTSINVAIDTLTPVAGAGITDQIDCLDPVISLQGSGQTFSGNAIIQWTTLNGNIVAGANTLSPQINQAGTYQLTVTDDMNGCTAMSQVVITSDFAIPTVVIANPPLLTCALPLADLNASGSVSGPQITPTWSTVNGSIVSGGNSYQPTISSPGTYQLIQIDANSGCKDSASVVVKENKIQPMADAGLPSQIACLGDSAILDGTGSTLGNNITYDWYLNLTGPPVVSNQITGYAKAAGTYTLVVTDQSNGCRDSSEVIIPADFLNDAVLTLIDKYCDDDVSDLEIGPVAGGVLPYLYSIDDGATQQADPLFRKLGPGIYPVVITDGKGCTWREEIEVLEEEGIQVTLPDDLTIELSDEVRIEGTTNVDPSTITQLTWYPPYGLDRTDSLVVFAKPGIAVLYTLTIQDERGCVGIDSITIVVHDPDLFIPTVFSPSNGDGVNDVFMIFGEVKGLVQINRFEVFSRWGERLFLAEDIQPNDPKGGWDGTQAGQKLNPGVYVYYAQILLTDGRVKTMKGEVILLE
ncbi:MAG: choice-of-anchor L domain-containing protein [Saprospiraceae bacterium]|nr:choice-of-anchor L domain-containing protein [Saprospiraceae bacterium]